jgi:hypothetical protein
VKFNIFLIQNSPVVCVCLYRDISGLFNTTIPETDSPETTKLHTANKSLNAKKYTLDIFKFKFRKEILINSVQLREMDDEEDYLYGDTNTEESRPTEDKTHAKFTPQQK